MYTISTVCINMNTSIIIYIFYTHTNVKVNLFKVKLHYGAIVLCSPLHSCENVCESPQRGPSAGCSVRSADSAPSEEQPPTGWAGFLPPFFLGTQPDYVFASLAARCNLVTKLQPRGNVERNLPVYCNFPWIFLFHQGITLNDASER